MESTYIYSGRILVQGFQIEAYGPEAVVAGNTSRLGIFHPAVIEIPAAVGQGHDEGGDGIPGTGAEALGPLPAVLEVITRVSREADSPECIVRCMFDQLKLYTVRHQALFLDDTAAAVFAESFSRYHTILRRQLAEPLLKYCGSEFAGEFVAEALLTWTMAGIEFDELYGMIRKLF